MKRGTVRTLARLGTLTGALWVFGCGDGDGGEGDTAMTSTSMEPTGTPPGTPSMAVGDTPAGEPDATPGASTMPGATEPDEELDGPAAPGAEPAPSEPEVPPAAEPSVEPDVPGSTATLAEVCARAEECSGDPAAECEATLAEDISSLQAICPEIVGAYLECLATMEGCDPDVECAAETAGLSGCLLEGPAVDVSEETVAMACAVMSSCDESDAAECEATFALLSPVIEGLCPGGFGPYLECVAQMSGCDPEVECPEESATLEACGLDVNGVDMMGL